MNIRNIDMGAKRALVAFLVERGVSPEAAEGRAEAKLAEASARLESTLRAQGRDIDFNAALDDLKTWAVANV